MVLVAEIADKMGTAADTASVTCFLAIPILLLGFRSRRHSLFTIPIVLFVNFLVLAELSDRALCPAIAREMGYGWVAWQFIALNMPFVIAFGLVFWIPRGWLEKLRP